MIATLTPVVGVNVVNQVPELSHRAQRFVHVRADLQGRITPISRYCRVGIQGWSVRGDGAADIGDAFDLAASAGSALESLPLTGILLNAEIQSGPFKVADTTYSLEYQYLTALLELSV